MFVVSLDALFADHPPSSLRAIKIDTEGQELAVLQGAERLLATAAPYVVAEVNRFGLRQMDAGPALLASCMKSHGYSTHRFGGGQPVPFELTDQEQGDLFNVLFAKELAKAQDSCSP